MVGENQLVTLAPRPPSSLQWTEWTSWLFSAAIPPPGNRVPFLSRTSVIEGNIEVSWQFPYVFIMYIQKSQRLSLCFRLTGSKISCQKHCNWKHSWFVDFSTIHPPNNCRNDTNKAISILQGCTFHHLWISMVRFCCWMAANFVQLPNKGMTLDPGSVKCCQHRPLNQKLPAKS